MRLIPKLILYLLLNIFAIADPHAVNNPSDERSNLWRKATSRARATMRPTGRVSLLIGALSMSGGIQGCELSSHSSRTPPARQPVSAHKLLPATDAVRISQL